MKLLYNLIFVCFIFQITFLNLLSMEEKPLKKKESLSSSLEQTKSSRSKVKKKQSFNKKASKLNQNILENLPNDFRFLDTFDTFNPIPIYAGILPEGTEFLIKSLLNVAIIIKKLNPVLVKIVGSSDVGKTMLIDTIAQRTSHNNYYSKIDLHETLLDSTHHNSYKLDPEKYIESLIEKFYQPKNNVTCASIVAFTKELPLKNNEFKKLRNFLLEIQKSYTAPLLVLHEGEKMHKTDGNYHDKIIYIQNPSLKSIKALFRNKFDQYSFKYEKIENKTIEALEGSLPPYIQRIAEDVLRNAFVQKKDYITNDFIQEILQKQPCLYSKNN